MYQSTRIIGAKGFLAKIRAHPQLIHREIESVLKQEARALAVEYASATMPGPGLQDGGKVEAFRKTVESDIRRVFASRADPNQIYRLMQVHAPNLAKAYWHAYKSKKPRAMAEILRKANLPQGLNPADHSAARTGKNGRVKKNQKLVSVANDAQLRVFVRKQRALVGFAKAGWACAAKGLGGRVRRNTRDATGGSRKTAESFPKYVRALARKFPDAGGARLLIEGTRITIEIFTNVTHADVAMPKPLYEAATSRAQQKTTLALTYALQELNKRIFRAA
jgi:hypothetical protein